MTTKTVFISYAREDIESARQLYYRLSDFGLDPWMDEKKLLPGQQWKAALRNAINNCRYFLLLLSSHSVTRSGYVHKELSEALDILDTYPESEIYLIPVRLDNCQMPKDRLREIQWVDMFPDWDTGVSRILSAIDPRLHDQTKEQTQEKFFLSGMLRKDAFERLSRIMNECDSPPIGGASPIPAVMSSVDSNAMLFNETVPPKPKSNDPNASSWARIKSLQAYDSIDGFWSSRWCKYVIGGPPSYRKVYTEWEEGTALMKIAGEWVFIEYEDDTNCYIIRARQMQNQRLVGRYLNVNSTEDTSPWVGVIVDNRRIDGFWSHYGRWDFRR